MAFSFQVCAQLLLKNASLPPILFLDSDTPCCFFFHTVIKCAGFIQGKNASKNYNV